MFKPIVQLRKHHLCVLSMYSKENFVQIKNGCRLTYHYGTSHKSFYFNYYFFYLFRFVDWVSARYQVSWFSFRNFFSNTGIQSSPNHLKCFSQRKCHDEHWYLCFIDFTQSWWWLLLNIATCRAVQSLTDSLHWAKPIWYLVVIQIGWHPQSFTTFLGFNRMKMLLIWKPLLPENLEFVQGEPQAFKSCRRISTNVTK